MIIVEMSWNPVEIQSNSATLLLATINLTEHISGKINKLLPI
jgi:hypothetical protein